MNKNAMAISGIGASDVVGIVFVILKLLKVIDWSWWWVTVPFWGPISLTLLAVAIMLIVFAIQDRNEMERRRKYQ